MTTQWLLLLTSGLFCAGIYGVLTRRNAIALLLSISTPMELLMVLWLGLVLRLEMRLVATGRRALRDRRDFFRSPFCGRFRCRLEGRVIE